MPSLRANKCRASIRHCWVCEGAEVALVPLGILGIPRDDGDRAECGMDQTDQAHSPAAGIQVGGH